MDRSRCLPQNTMRGLAEDDVVRMRLLIPSIKQLCNFEGIPGCSVGVIHHGETLWTQGFGFRDQAKSRIPDADTRYGIGAITRSMVAAGIAKLVDDGLIEWTTTVKEVLPDFSHADEKFTSEVTIADLLSHRSGLNGDAYDRLAYHDNDGVLLPYDLLLKVFKDIPLTAPIRQKWLLCPWGYSIAAYIIAQVSGLPLHEYLREKLFDPLGMSATTLRPSLNETNNVADPHSTLRNGVISPLDCHPKIEGTVFEGDRGAYSSVNDLLKWAQAILAGVQGPEAAAKAKVKQVPHMIGNQISTVGTSLLERSYGFGWNRNQLPGTALVDENGLGVLSRHRFFGVTSQSRLMIYHQGMMAGYSSFLAIFPETRSAIAVLTNTASPSDAVGWIAKTLIKGLFNSSGYVNYTREAQHARKVGYERFQTLQENLTRERVQGTKPLPLVCYVGKYINTDYNYLLEITLSPESKTDLMVSFQGRSSQPFTLRHYHDHIFEWSLDYDEMKKRGRKIVLDPSYYKFHFEIYPDNRASKIIWHLEDSSLPNGITFMWKDEHLEERWRAVHNEITTRKRPTPHPMNVLEFDEAIKQYNARRVAKWEEEMDLWEVV